MGCDIVGRQLTRETRFRIALDDVPGNIYVIRCLQPNTRGSETHVDAHRPCSYWLPRRRMPVDQANKGAQCVGLFHRYFGGVLVVQPVSSLRAIAQVCTHSDWS
jgi:hypothetical protein